MFDTVTDHTTPETTPLGDVAVESCGKPVAPIEADGLPLLPDSEAENVGGRRSPLRRCIVTGIVGEKGDMLRFVLAPDGAVVLDLGENLPGRGLWLTATPAVLDKAVARNAFAKAARRAARADRELVGLVAQSLRRRCLDLIGLARKGGGVVTGFEKVQAALRTNMVGTAGRAGIWLEARDGSHDGRTKLAGMAKALGLPLLELFNRAELGAALGREDAVHAIVAAGPLSQRLLRDANRLATLEPSSAPGP